MRSMDRNDLLEAFRDTMRHIPGTVYAVTTGHKGERFGIIATAVSSLSFDPPSLLVCINRAASLHGPMACADTFCINVLSPQNRAVADCFVRSASGEERFAVGEWSEELGVPVLASAQSSLICRVADRHDFGTHTIFIGELIAARHRHNARPLTWYDGQYIDISGAPAQDAVG